MVKGVCISADRAWGVRLRWMDAITVSRKCQVMEATDVDGPALKKVMD
jgi:hypothetical protein